jgi:hypothetical protein
MLTRSHRMLTAKHGAVLALAMISVSAGSVASADSGQPQQGGGCHMVFSPSTTGLNQMMGNASSTAAQNMVAMLSKFSNQQFCGA